MMIKASIIDVDGRWGTSGRLLVVHQIPRKGEWVELDDGAWYEVVNVAHRCLGFAPETDEKTATARLAKSGDTLGSMEDLPNMATIDVIVVLRPIPAP